MVISDPDTFAWSRSDHMRSTQAVGSEAIRATLQQWCLSCCEILNQIGTVQGRSSCKDATRQIKQKTTAILKIY